MVKHLIVAAGVLALTSTAAAHPHDNPYRTVDRQGPYSYFGIDLGIGDPLADDADGEIIAFRFDLHGQVLVSPTAGIYGDLPLSIITTTDDTVDDQSITGLGNLELGGFLFTAVGTGDTTRLVFRGGLTLPTADDDEGVFANLLATLLVRVNDLTSVVPDIGVLRTSVSIIHETESVAIRFDGGLDTPLFSTDDDIDLERDPLIRLNAAAAFGQGPTKFVVELVNLANADNLDEDDAFIHQLSAGISTRVDKLSLGISASLLLDSILEEEEDGTYIAVIGSLASHF